MRCVDIRSGTIIGLTEHAATLRSVKNSGCRVTIFPSAQTNGIRRSYRVFGNPSETREAVGMSIGGWLCSLYLYSE